MVTLILVTHIEHGNILLNKFNKITKSKNIIFIHGSSKDREKNRKLILDGFYDIVIASDIFKEGVDIPNLKCLILACGGKSSVALIQRIGRLLRLFPGKDKAIIYDFADDCKYLRSHYKRRLELLKGIKSFQVNEIET